MALNTSIQVLITVLHGIINIIRIIRLIRMRRQRRRNTQDIFLPPMPNIMVILQTIILIMQLLRIRRKRRGGKTRISKLISLLRGYRWQQNMYFFNCSMKFLNQHPSYANYLIFLQKTVGD